jgi:hypothetical protein
VTISLAIVLAFVVVTMVADLVVYAVKNGGDA